MEQQIWKIVITRKDGSNTTEFTALGLKSAWEFAVEFQFPGEMISILKRIN
jgi:hypothetical protein